MRVIDAHVHLYPPEAGREPTAWAAAHDEAHWAALCTRRRGDSRPVQGFPTAAELLREMDACGVERAVLLGWYWEHHATCVTQNRFYTECVRAHPDRLSAFATLHPAGGPAALEEVRRARSEGLIGLGELSPHSQHVALTDPTWNQVLHLAGELGLPVNLHVTDPASRKFPGRVETPLEDFRRLASAHPATNFILAHWGGGLAFEPRSRLLPNIWFDTSATPLLYASARRTEILAAAAGGRLLFGSDYPLILYPEFENAPALGRLVEEFKAAGVSAEVMARNAARLLGLR
jgi:predicted TIM-barrel fold metal-dependent hydrolase